MIKASNPESIARNRAPRVQIEYVVEVYGTDMKVQLPFIIGVLADLSGMPAEPLDPVAQRQMLEIDVDNFDDRLLACTPGVAFRVPNTLTGEGQLVVDLKFRCMDDFSPERVAQGVEELHALFQTRTPLADLLTYVEGKPDAEHLIAKAMLDPELLQSLAAASPWEKQLGEARDFYTLLKQAFDLKSDTVQEIVEHAVYVLARVALEQPVLIQKDIVETMQAMISDVDRRLGTQLNAILHHPEFQKLEGTWRGLHYLVHNAESDEMLKIKIFNISKQDCFQTLRKFKGRAWDQSPLFNKIYEEEYGTFGGEPFGCLVGDFYFDASPPDVDMLFGLARIAAFSHAPLIAGADPAVMRMDSWQELSNIRDLNKIFQTPEYSLWRALRECEDSRYIGLAMPRFLARLPYGPKTAPIEEFDFEEDVEGGNSSKFTWANSSFAMAANIARAFKLYGWCSRIRGEESGGVVEGLPTYVFPTDDGEVDMKCPTEIAITDRREAELASNGFMPLMHKKNADLAAFIGVQSLKAPVKFDDPDAAANANLGARLPYLLSCCRFAHYLKCIVRDKVSGFKNHEEMQNWLQNWIMQYVDEEPESSSEEAKVRKPLAAAEVVVEEANPTYYTSKFFLRPHYQLDGLSASLRLVSKLPSAYGG